MMWFAWKTADELSAVCYLVSLLFFARCVYYIYFNRLDIDRINTLHIKQINTQSYIIAYTNSFDVIKLCILI